MTDEFHWNEMQDFYEPGVDMGINLVRFTVFLVFMVKFFQQLVLYYLNWVLIAEYELAAFILTKTALGLFCAINLPIQYAADLVFS